MLDERIYPNQYSDEEIAAVKLYRKLRSEGISKIDALGLALPMEGDSNIDATIQTLFTLYRQDNA